MRKPSPEKAFTLIEVMFAVTFLMIGLVAVIRAYHAALNAIGRTENIIIASGLLEDKMEDVRRKILENQGIEEGSESGQFEGDFNKTYFWNLSVVSSNISKSYNDVILDVSWDESNKTQKLSTLAYVKRRDAGSDEKQSE